MRPWLARTTRLNTIKYLCACRLSQRLCKNNLFGEAHANNFARNQNELWLNLCVEWVGVATGTTLVFLKILQTLFSIDHLRYIVDSLISLTRWLLTKIGSRVFFFPMAPSEDSERAERLTNTLFGAKDGGRHRQERAVILTSLRRTRRRCAWVTVPAASWRSINS